MPSRLKRQIIMLAMTFVVVLVMKFVVDDWLQKQSPAPTGDGVTTNGTTVETP
jgi:hypothetical protein